MVGLAAAVVVIETQAIGQVVVKPLVVDGAAVAVGGDPAGRIIADDAGIGAERIVRQTAIAIEIAAVRLAIAPGPAFRQAEGLIAEVSEQDLAIGAEAVDAALAVIAITDLQAGGIGLAA